MWKETDIYLVLCAAKNSIKNKDVLHTFRELDTKLNYVNDYHLTFNVQIKNLL